MPGPAPEQLLAEATRCVREGRIADGIRAYRELLSIRPQDADSWYNLGYLQRVARDFAAALSSYAKAIEQGIARAEEVRLNRAVIFSEHFSDAPSAEAELLEAVRLNPRFVAGWLNLGNVYEDAGEAAKARTAYERVLAIEPANGRAAARLAAIDVFERRPQQALDQLEGTLATAGIGHEDYAEAAFAAGHALDALGEYERAFGMFEQANRAARESAGGMRYDAEQHERFVDRLIETFPLTERAPPDDRDRAPIFVCGMFRSGSTLAEQILGRHSRVTAGGELDFVPALVAHHLQPYPESLAGASAARLAELRGAYARSLASRHPGAGIVTDKRPDNFLHIGLIKAIFPEVKIVHTTREPLDNILSIYFLYFHDSITYGFDLGDIAHWYGQYRRLMKHWKAAFAEDIFDLSYDELVREPRAAVGGLLEFCGLPWEDSCLAADRDGAAVRTASVWQVRQPLHDRSSGRWRNYERQLAQVRERLAGLIRD